MGLVKKGKNWFIDYRFPPGRQGKRIREKIGPVTKDEATIVLSTRLKDILVGKNPELRRIKPRPFDAVVKEFEEKHAALCRDPKSYKDKTRVLLRAFEGMMLQEVTTKAIEDFARSRLTAGASRATCNRMRATLSKIFNWAIDRGYFSGENPARKVKRFPESPGRVRFLTAEEASKLIDHAPRHLRPVIIAALHTGGRRGEILTLRWEDVDLAQGVLYFDQTNTKSGKQREIPIDGELTAVLQEQRKRRFAGGDAREYVFTRFGKRLGDIRTAFGRARERAGLGQDVTFQVLRHSFASWYMINGGDLYRLQKYLGHSTITLTQRYAHLSKDYLKEGVRYFGAPAAIGGQTVDIDTPVMASFEPVSR